MTKDKLHGAEPACHGVGVLMRFRRSARGNVAIIFALSLIPLITAIGSAIDLSRALIVRHRLSKALDAAALAVGSAVGLSGTQIEDLANDYFRANYPVTELGIPGHLNVLVYDNRVQLSADAQLPTTIVSVIGIDYITVASEAEVIRESRKLEVAMVLDNTGSMNSNGKIAALRSAATELVNILFGEQDFPQHLRMSLVPFVTSVNILNEEFSMNWMDTTAQSQYHGENFDLLNGQRVSHFYLYDQMTNADWKGCVEMRPAPYDISDEPPNPAIPNTLYVPYLWPDEPDSGSYSNKYKSDGTPSTYTPAQRQMFIPKYTGSVTVDNVPSETRGPNKSCADPIVPLSNDKQRLLTAVGQMAAWNNSGTNIAAGLVWGWATLSPNEPFTTGASFGAADTQKALILLTDGRNEVVSQSTHNGSDYGGYGYIAKARNGTTSISTAVGIINTKVGSMCTTIKQLDVRVYTILFQINDVALQNLFRTCASEPELYFEVPTSAELNSAFRSIARDLSNLRLSR